jgi:hypothetical protein
MNVSTCIFPVLLASLAASHAVTVFTDDFESPVIESPSYNITGTSATSRTASSDWVRSSTGYGSGSNGIIVADYEGFTAPGGNQAYGFRYTNSGLTSAFGVIGSLGQIGDTITITFDVFDDGTNNGDTPMTAALVTFDGAGTRTNTASGGLINNTASYIATVSGSAPASGFSTWQIDYTVGNDVLDSNGIASGGSTTFDPSTLGQDIAIRFQGATNSASIDNVNVSIVAVPESSSVFLGGLGILLMLRRRRR